MIKESKAYKYATWCANNEDGKVGKYVKKQAKYWLDIANGLDDEAYIDESDFELICTILELMVHPDTRLSMYESLEDYQWFFIIAVLCTRYKKDNSRYYETGLLEICRKNFKTFTAGIVFIICLIIEPQFSRFFSVAPNYKLSCELKLAVDKIIKCSPALRSKFKINNDIVRCNITDNEYTPLAYSNDSLDGKLAVVFNIDEAGLLPDYPLEAMRSSQITLRDKLGIVISTQYPNDNNVMLTEIDISKKTLDRMIDNRRYFALLYEPDEEIRVNWRTDDNVIYQSNPVSLNNESIFNEILKKRAMAIEYESKRENYLCKHNNIQYKSQGTEGYINSEQIQACKSDEEIDWNGREVYLGIDLASTEDNTAVSMVTYDYETENILAKSWAFIPEERVSEKSNREKVDYVKEIELGNCFDCGEDTISYNFVRDFIMSIEEKYGVKIVAIGYDLRDMNSTREDLKDHYDMVEVRQHSSVLHSPIKWLKESILNKKFVYNENKLLEINFTNCIQTEDTNLNKYLNKKKSKGKIDMVMAMVTALYLLQQKVVIAEEEDWAVQTI
ncbi:terminase TerL endonuclease subunit [Romboutsia timonensis]|uniref:terminase TerL endonuclease subunit n=1 Tax=Romboutsia timonensis TaxID=1776391 RepID=UPI002A8224D8|nr:terminase TerL endonuclease subunit [Romboutsia timonensis]MDY3960177.1 terminase TerL endonuclease subunit [Romboutsia timonensis]